MPSTILSDNYIALPSGTTAERPASPTNGMIRYNSTLGYIEGYDNGSWNNVLRGNVGDVAIKEGAVSIAAPYTNNWHFGWHNGTSLDATTSGSGIIVNTTGVYYVYAYQRAAGVTNTWASLAENGNRANLDATQNAGTGSYSNYFGHDHTAGPGNWTLSVYCGTLTAGQKITHGAPATTGYPLEYAIAGHNAGIQVWRLK